MGVPLNVVTAGGDTDGSPITKSHTLAAGSNRRLIVTLTSEINADLAASVFSVSFGGVALTEDVFHHTSPSSSAFNKVAAIYSLTEPNFPAGATNNVEVTYPAGSGCHVGITICTLPDMADAGPESTASDGTRATVTSYTIGVTPTSSDPTIISVSATQSPSTFTQQPGQVEITDFTVADSIDLSHAHATRYKRPGAAGPTSITSVVNGDARRHCVAAAAYGQAAAGGGTFTGTAASTSGAASASATGEHPFIGTAAAQSGAASAAASGSFTAPAGTFIGTAASETGPASAAAQGTFASSSTGTAAATSGAAQASASGTATEPAGARVGQVAASAAPASARIWGLVAAPLDLSGIGDAEILEVGVPYSVNSIINGALDLIKANPIASLSDTSSHVANGMKRQFDVERDALLREYPWNFAMRRTKLAASSTPPEFRFQYAYEMPAGPDPLFCLRVWAVGNEENRQDSDVWEISGRLILTDLSPPLPIRYIGREINPARWDALTVKALEARLAWQYAFNAVGSAALAEEMARIYNMRLDTAKSVDAQEGTPEPFEDGTTWVDSRQAGVGW